MKYTKGYNHHQSATESQKRSGKERKKIESNFIVLKLFRMKEVFNS